MCTRDPSPRPPAASPGSPSGWKARMPENIADAESQMAGGNEINWITTSDKYLGKATELVKTK